MRVLRCQECEVLFLWPPLLDEEAAEYYAHYSKHLHQRGVAENETPEETFRRRSRGGKYRVEMARRFLKKGDAILDIGGGCGNFLVDMGREKLTSRAVLVESCREHLEFAREGLGIEGYEDAEEVEGPFDAIFLFHILEHIMAPAPFLKRCSALLVEKGLVIVEVPCSRDPLISLYESAPYKDFYFQPMHPYTHCSRSLELLFSGAGFESVQFIPFQRYPLSNHLQWLSNGKQGGNARFAEVLGSECEETYKRRLESSGFTDTLFGIFRKG